MNGLYLASPHARLIWEGEKKSIATGKRVPITGECLVCSKEGGVGLAFGIAQVGDPAVLDITSFDSRVSSHQVTKTNRRKWWPDARSLYDYPVLRFSPFPSPIEVPIEPGVTMDMGPVSFPQVSEAVKSLLSPVEEGELVIMSTPDRIMSSSPSDGEKAPLNSGEEEAMPWTTDDPPRPAKNWTTEEKKKCVAAANAAISKDPKDEQGAIFACIRAAGKTQHPGGKKEVDPEDYVIAEDLVRGFLATLDETEKAGDMGDGETHTCTCPNCGEKVEKELGSPCREEECPKCGSRLRGGDEDTESKETDEGGEGPSDTSPSGDEPAPTDDFSTLLSSLPTSQLTELRGALSVEAGSSPIVQATLDKIETELSSRAPSEEKAGRRINSSILDKLRKIFTQLKEVLDFGENSDKEPDVVAQLSNHTFKTYATKDGKETWFEIWPTNSYEDREREFFTSRALKDFVERHEPQEVKGEAWFWHVPGSKFGTIYHQAIIEDHFLVQLGKFDDTTVGNALKEFFSQYPSGHPKIAPWGWGASHGYAYVQADRERDGTYNWFDIKESSALPVHYAANPHNPPFKSKEVEMNDKQREAFEEIGKLVGVPDLVEQITASAHLKKEELDGKVQHKSVDTPPETEEKEQVPDATEKKDESPFAGLTPEVVRQLTELLTPTIGGPAEEEVPPAEEKDLDVSEVTKEIVSSLHLDALSDAFSSLLAEVKEVKDRLDQVERDDKAKVQEMADLAFQPSWFAASAAKETVQSPPATQNLTSAIPDAVKGIVSHMDKDI